MTVPKLTDFKDWFSPMIVKELRQGTRTRIFSFAFILLQAALIIVMLSSLASTRSGSSGGSSFGFWFCIIIAFGVVMPLRGFAAISNEMKMNTLDMVLLTRLSATKIIFGKWAALFSQTLLVASALLPFIVIRYFLGGIDLVNEAIWLMMLVIISGALTAVTVGLSAQPSNLLRGAVALGILFFGFSAAANAMFMVSMGGGPSFTTSEFWEFFAVMCTTCVFGSYFLLAMGASHFAPISENHATRKRLFTLLYLAVMVLFYVLDFNEEVILAFAGFILTVVVIDALTERPAPVASVYIPFVKRGALGRLSGKLLYPGWQSGLLFCGLIIGVFVFMLMDSNNLDEDEWASVISAIGALIFPAALIQLVFQRASNTFGLYILIALLTGTLCMLIYAMDDSQNTGVLWFLCFIPFSCFVIAGNRHDYHGADTIFVVSAVVTLLWILIFLIKSISIHRQIHRLENVVKDLIDKERIEIDNPDQ